MSKKNFDSELAAHNIATILTKSCIGEIDKEQISLSATSKDPMLFINYSKKYAYFYKNFYDRALEHFNTVLNDDWE